jgi:excisionase family DNA binding protein
MTRRGVFTTAEVADVSGLAKISVVWNIKHGKLKAEKVGGIWLVSATDLEAWLRERESE